MQSVSLNDEPLDPAGLVDGRLPLTGLRPENVLRVRARMAYSSDGEGMHRHVDPADGRTYLYAMSFLDAAPRWFGCFDQPDLKASFDLEVRCPPEWTVIGNGAATRSAPGHWRLASTRPLATYFVTLVAGPYASITAEHDGIALGLHARASLAPHLQAEAADILGVTTAALDRYHELFGIRYPFGEYHQAFVPDFNAGAMENPGCVTLRDQYIFRSAATRGQRSDRASTITHEMAHMWFGDLVTMRWWDDLWLNESFAEYMGYRVCAELTGEQGGLAELAWLEFGLHRKDWGRVADQSPSNHPVAGNGSSDAAGALADFDGISYAKGASALKQLAAHLGDEVFFAGLRRHFQRHQFGNAEFADLIAAWTEAGAVDLDSWAERWLRTSGLDTLTAEQRPAGTDRPRPAASGTAAAARCGSAVARRTRSQRPHTVRVTGFDAQARPRLDEQVTLRLRRRPGRRRPTPARCGWWWPTAPTTAGPRSGSARPAGSRSPSCCPGSPRRRPGWCSTTPSATPSATPSSTRRRPWTWCWRRWPRSRWSWWPPSCCSSPPTSWPAAMPGPRTGRPAGPGWPPWHSSCWPAPRPAATPSWRPPGPASTPATTPPGCAPGGPASDCRQGW